MAKQVTDRCPWLSGEPERVVFRAALAYRRMLEDFARILTTCRRRSGLQMMAISEKTAIPLRRIDSFEHGAVPPSWMEGVLLAPVYGVRLSFITRRLKRVLGRVSGDDARSIEACLQCHRAIAPGLTSADRERINEKLKAPLSERFVDVTIADWPSCFPPSLSTLLMVEYEMIVARMRDINACIAQVQPDGAERRETLRGIHRGLVDVATGLQWHLDRHCPSESGGSRLTHHANVTIEERTMHVVGEGMKQCRATVIHAASRLEPFARLGAGWGDGDWPLPAERPKSSPCLYAGRPPALEDALVVSVLRLGNAATQLIDLKEKLS